MKDKSVAKFSVFVSAVLFLVPRWLSRNVTQSSDSIVCTKEAMSAEGFWIFVYQRDADSYSGRAPEPFFAGGKMRNLERLKWWEDYAAKDSRQGNKTPWVRHRKHTDIILHMYTYIHAMQYI